LFAPGGPIVDAGCGTGSYTIELDRAGFRATGIDASPELIEQAKRKAREAGSDATFQVGDLRTWRPDAPSDGVLCRGVLNDFLEDDDRRAALDSLSRMLRAGGRLVLDVRDWEASAARYAVQPVVERSSSGLTFRSETTLRPADHVLLVRERIEFRDEVEEFDFAMRCWTPDELSDRLTRAGFGEVELLGEPSARADRIVAVATRGG
jgi:trans-aconitate methyltransferase